MESIPNTIPELMRLRAKTHPESVYCYHRSLKSDWISISWGELWKQLCRATLFLRRKGLKKGDVFAILLPTSLEWDLAEKAALCIGAVVLGIEQHAAVKQIEGIINKSQPAFMLVDDHQSLKRFISGANPAKVIHLEEFRDGIREYESSDQILETDVEPNNPASMIFTSGTTGEPKGIVFTHEQFMLACRELLSIFRSYGQNDSTLAWMPLANLFQRIMNLCSSATLAPIYFLDDPRQVMDTIRCVNPSFFIGVPRFYEKLMKGILQRIDEMHPIPRRLVQAALKRGQTISSCIQKQEKPSLFQRWIHFFEDFFILKFLRRVMGSNLTCMITGSAACPLHILLFFEGIGLPLMEAYGISENIVPIAINRPTERRLGSVGKPVRSNEIRIEEDQEILVKGPGLFKGYEGGELGEIPFTSDGYYRTGDLGYLDREGFLYLTGRKTEWVKTSTGRRIYLGNIEQKLKAIPYFEQLIVIAKDRKTVTILAFLDSKYQRMDDETLFRELICELEKLSASLADYERPSGVLLIDKPFSVEAGEMTANLKIKRRVIENNYAADIEALYQKVENLPSSHEKASLILCRKKTIL